MIRIATIGTSPITCDFIEVLNACDRAAFVGTLSRNAERAAAFTAEHGGSLPFCDLAELAASDEVDAVYLGSPNALHHRQALACIAGGKHVLAEKPLGANRAQAQEVFDAAEAKGVVAMEAMRPVHDPAFQLLRDALPELGRIRRATLRFGKYSSRYDDILAGRHTNIFDCAMASGSLMDIGVYTVEPLVALFGEPESVVAAGVLLDESTRELTGGPIDGAGVICAKYADMVATLHHSKITADLADNQIEGELGTLTFEGVSAPVRARIDLRGKAVRDSAKGYSGTRTTSRELPLPACDNTMCYELADFVCAVEAVAAGTPPLEAMAGEHGTVARFRDITLASLGIMDEARHQMGVAFPADR